MINKIDYYCYFVFGSVEFSKFSLADIVLTGMEMEDHTGHCSYEMVYCENKCGHKIQRRLMVSFISIIEQYPHKGRYPHKRKFSYFP
jgi:hypothetical protein